MIRVWEEQEGLQGESGGGAGGPLEGARCAGPSQLPFTCKGSPKTPLRAERKQVAEVPGALKLGASKHQTPGGLRSWRELGNLVHPKLPPLSPQDEAGA